jgi:hypothetical protein
MNEYEKLLIMRQRCDTMLLSMLGQDHAPRWWKSKNKAFNNITPEEQWDKHPFVVYRYLLGYIDGYG